MLIDNKVDRYPDDGFDIKTVWDFINEFSGKKSQQTGNLDIVTGYLILNHESLQTAYTALFLSAAPS